MIETLVQQVGHVWQRCLAEENLKKLSRAIESSPASVVITDTNGTIEYVNSKFAEVTGYSQEEAIGENSQVLIAGDQPMAFYKDLWDTILSGKVWRGEFRNKKKSGETYWESASISPISNAGGEITHFVAVKEDITVRKRMEQSILNAKEAAEDATQAKSDFLANMSHEIRTPMNAVIGMSHLALKTELTPKQKDYLNKIQSSANSLLGIINDILDFSKIEAGKLDMESVEFNLDDVLDNLANLVMVKAQEKENLEVLFATAREVPRFLLGDPLRLGQVLINLANNAVKFTDSGEIVVSTELLKQDEAGLALKFSVRDTGIGLTEAQIGKLFQSFSQADTSTTRKFGGTGLGLTISKRLVNMMGGEIWVESKPGQGTNFSFTAKFGLGKKKAKKRLVPSSDMRGMKVLVVDDSATSRNILRDILESFSFEVTLAASGEEGLEDIQKADADQPYELVIMDWKMPGLDGIEAARRIKNHQALSKLPAIIMVTAYGREEIMQQAEQIGLEGFLIKPVSPSVLFDTTMQALGEGITKTSRISERNEESKDLKDIQGAQILLVEDNEINQQVAKEILAGGGLNVTVANDGQEAVNAVKDSYYDAILMDIQMPVMDGYAAARKIREWEEKLKAQGSKLKGKDSEDLSAFSFQPSARAERVPIIAMTAHAMAGDEKKSIKAGMNDHITKPIDPDKLFATLQNWIKPVSQRAAVQIPPVLDAPPDPDQMVLGEDELPESLPEFNLAAGLSRLMGNKRLYRKLLLDFGANYGGVADEIRESLAIGDFEQAHSLVHNLKGLAGNLEATNLQAAAVELEKLVRGQTAKTAPDKDLNQKFAELENALGQALDAVQTLGPTADKKTVASSKEAVASVPPELIQKVTESIKTAADMGDVIQIKSIAEELKSESDAMGPFCDELIQLAEDFDFDGILKFVNELEGKIPKFPI
jgi:PAS domain S-box-containing protein